MRKNTLNFLLVLALIGVAGYVGKNYQTWFPPEEEVSSIVSEEPVSETLINVVVSKTILTFDEETLFNGGTNTKVNGGTDRMENTFIVDDITFTIATQQTITNFAIEYPSGVYDHFGPNFAAGPSWAGVSVSTEFDINLVNSILVNGNAINITQNIVANGFRTFQFSGSNICQNEFNDVFEFVGLENIAINPDEVLTDEFGDQYVLDVDGLTKLYLYQV